MLEEPPLAAKLRCDAAGKELSLILARKIKDAVLQVFSGPEPTAPSKPVTVRGDMGADEVLEIVHRKFLYAGDASRFRLVLLANGGA